MLDIVDCASITQDQLVKVLNQLVPGGLQALLLNHSGRCFGPKAVQAIIKSSSDTGGRGSLSALTSLAIGGAYMLTDEDSYLLIQGIRESLSSIGFKACPLLGQRFCSSIARCYASTPTMTSAPLLELVLEGLKLSQDDLRLLSSTDALRNLRNIELKYIDLLDDKCAEGILCVAGESLEGINFSHNLLLTDDVLSCIRRCNQTGNLRSLQLAGLKGLTKCGLETFFTRDIQGLPQPPALRVLDLSESAENTITDLIVELAVLSSSSAATTLVPSEKSANSLVGLVHLNISGAGTAVSDKSMENLVKYCSASLRLLNVSYCPNISSKGLGYLVTEVGDQLEKLSIWGMAQLTDEFHDGHRRSRDTRFEVIGSWMKKSAV